MLNKKSLLGKGMKKVLAVVLSVQMVLGGAVPSVAAEMQRQSVENVGLATAAMQLDSAWEVENKNNNLVVNNDGSITITTEAGTIGGAAMNNVLYQKLPNQTDYDFTVKVSGNFTQNYQGAYLMITTGKNLANAVGVVRRYHGYLGDKYGTTQLMGVMQDGDPQEFYEGAANIGNSFYLRLKKNNGRITGYYASSYSENESNWNQIVDGNTSQVDKGSALVSPEEIYIALGAASGGENNATQVTFSDLRIGGVSCPLASDPDGFYSLELTGGADKIDENGTTKFSLTGYNASKTRTFTNFNNVTFTSSNTGVATVDNNGNVTGKGIGKVTISASATYNGITRTATKNIQVGDLAAANFWTATSPNGATVITAQLMTDGTLWYGSTQDGAATIPTSPAGIVTSIADFSKDLEFVNVSQQKINESYATYSGKKDKYTNHCNETTITFVSKNNRNAEMDFIIRAYDDGVAYRYAIRNKANANGELKISEETGGVQLPEKATVYWMNYTSKTWNYEGTYSKTTTEGLQVNSTPSIPILYEVPGTDKWTLFSEADLHGTYCGSMVRVEEDGLLRMDFAPLQTTDVVTKTPFTSPWRAAITGTTEMIVENTLIENLNPPANEVAYKFSEWVDPGLSSWSWVANWGSGISDQSKKETHINWINFGAEIGWDYYILDEGWANGGRGQVNGMRDWWPEVKQVAAEKGVKLWAWIHVSDIDTQAERDKHFSLWSKEGIVGIKPDFFDGENQKIIQLYDDLYKDCAKYKLMALVHGANKPTGEVRTWPNIYGREAIRGQESGGITAEQYTLIPFIRAAIGPAEVTEELKSKDYNKTTMGFQIALTALIEDGIHSMGSAPDVYRGNELGMEYYMNYPDRWNETQFVDGKIGEYLSIARRTGNEWYLSGISVAERTMEVPMDFLDSKSYTALIYHEDHTKNNGDERRRNLAKDTQIVTKVSKLEIPVLKGGGYAVRLIPGDDVSDKAIQSITSTEKDLYIGVGNSATPKVTMSPANAQYQQVTWSSSDKTVATVTGNGVIRGIKEGTVTITVQSIFNLNAKYEFNVTITPPRYELDKTKWNVLEQDANLLVNGTDSVTIKTQYGVLGDKPSTYKNLFGTNVAAGKDFSITAKISGGLKDNYQGVFLVAFDKNSPDTLNVAAGRRYHTMFNTGGNTPNNHFAMMSVGGSTGEFYSADAVSDTDAYIKLEKKGSVFSGYYSYDGKSWLLISSNDKTSITHENLAASANLYVGFYAGSGGGDSSIEVTVSEFTLDGVPVPVAIDNGEYVPPTKKAIVSFKTTPADANIVVTGKDGDVAASNGKYELLAGDYTYKVTSTDYVEATGTFTVEPGEEKEIEVALEIDAASYIKQLEDLKKEAEDKYDAIKGKLTDEGKAEAEAAIKKIDEAIKTAKGDDVDIETLKSALLEGQNASKDVTAALEKTENMKPVEPPQTETETPPTEKEPPQTETQAPPKPVVTIKNGDVVTIGNLQYVVSSASKKTVKVKGVVASKKSTVKTVKIPATVKLADGAKYKVTSIGNNAFARSKKLKKVVIGSNIKTIGKKAFYKASKLKTVQIKSKVLTKVGKQAFKGISSKAKISIPKSKAKSYTKKINKSGIAKTVKLK